MTKFDKLQSDLDAALELMNDYLTATGLTEERDRLLNIEKEVFYLMDDIGYQKQDRRKLVFSDKTHSIWFVNHSTYEGLLREDKVKGGGGGCVPVNSFIDYRGKSITYKGTHKKYN